jgi:hypothetical protein
MKPTTTTNVSIDGVMQGCDVPDEDRGDGFEHGGWSMPLRRHDPRDARWGEARATLLSPRVHLSAVADARGRVKRGDDAGVACVAVLFALVPVSLF